MEKKIDNFLTEKGLPSKEDLFAEFGLFEFSEESDWVVLLLEKLSDKVSTYIKFLEDMLQPDTNISSMHESLIFTNEERKKMFEILRNLFYWERLSLLIDLNEEETSKIKYFNDYFKYWKNIKEELKPYLNKAINTWKENETETKFEGYFG